LLRKQNKPRKNVIANNSNKTVLWSLKNGSFSGVKQERTQLSQRELEVLQLAAEGKSNKQIADMLNISYHTIDCHNRNILATLNAVNIKNAIAIAFRKNLLK